MMLTIAAKKEAFPRKERVTGSRMRMKHATRTRRARRRSLRARQAARFCALGLTSSEDWGKRAACVRCEREDRPGEEGAHC